MKNFAVILSGCGVYDGSEIHEAVLALLAIKKNGADYQLFAPDIMQHHVINHITGQEMSEKRNVLIESARIARGKIKNLKELNPTDFDALILPGGHGAAKNLSNYAFEGSNMKVLELLEEKLKTAHQMGKAIGFLCIAPVIAAKVFEGVKLTIGTDAGTASDIKKIGGKPINAPSGGVVIDAENKIFSTPCYMLDTNIAEVAESCENLVEAMMEAI